MFLLNFPAPAILTLFPLQIYPDASFGCFLVDEIKTLNYGVQTIV